ncbi:tolloid-like protein 1 isoform X2 [Biomphalaria glabrata]|nr:tolloid-like protein 1 isoform X2 [Biomphalaria glabrata]XP_013067340.2 tolloid-like protein 1 isoform X2 [Biomphalaria glabrata]XP_013067349.2 tolloid-like protein 1 isoform X2 [Biomphalaria glabrata]XP_013067358.2 tolloid-like protein 1 isoform X2 [Biomphalaria glabrata]XP_013067366.2 tolloid-like protein 1 isoform X2 [Biomphalaria glabrata]XP_013067375.2 tolloid-like protein 1 isoform X2 [Biomphalaria glabrata]XP_055875576.1 tolloid-like protein 1 isoform X2 [Biomphalaria glabrata]XP_0
MTAPKKPSFASVSLCLVVLTHLALSTQSVMSTEPMSTEPMSTEPMSTEPMSTGPILDPCKADAFIGDIALDAEDRHVVQGNFQKDYVSRSVSNNRNKKMPNTPEVKRRRKSKRNKRAATSVRDRLWDYGVIPYQIEPIFTSETKVLMKQAMKHWENYTCITFIERQPKEHNFILFTKSPCGCCSFVGKKGSGGQAVSIGENCDSFGVIIHELGHAIGFWHEHTRPDRDRHVQINSKNIIPGQEYNFNKLTSDDVNSLGETYDFDSIMHYANNTFAINIRSETLLPIAKPGTMRPQIGQRVRLSDLDIRQTNKLYACPSCGRTFQERKQQFTHTPKRGSREICQWRISAAHGEKITLNITNLDIPTSFNCRSHYLEVKDGHYLKSPLLGRFCGNQVPDTLISSGPRLWIEYRTEYGQGQGFTIAYEALCGGEIKKEEGIISSPNYPDHYVPERVCVWQITVPIEFTVALKFQTFDIENQFNCQMDYLEIRDGPSETSPLIGNFCGNKIPEDIQSTGHQLYLKFISDASVQRSGFFAMFTKEYDECSSDEHGCDQVCVNTLGSYTCACRDGYKLHADGKRCEDACGGYLDSENGTIRSPSYPKLYPSNKNCIWKLVAPPGHRITVNFTHFDLEGHLPSCQFDSVRISTPGDEGDAKVFGVFCGHKFPAPITSDNNSLKIEFNSDNSVQKTGFTAEYYTDKDECSVNNGGCQHICRNNIGSFVCDCPEGFTLNDDLRSCKEAGCHHDIKSHYGVITSPNYPEYYPSRSECVWHFSTAPGHRIRLQFRAFEVEAHQQCTYDYVGIYDGNSSSAANIGRLCGPRIPKPVTSNSNHLYMTLISDASVQRKGFEIEYDTVCGGHLEASASPQKIWSHPRFGDNVYDNNQTCEWKLHAKEGQTIELQFTFMDLEEDSDCGYDNVTIYDGLLDNSRPLGTFCGTELPTLISSRSQNILIYFHSDEAIAWKGFSATFNIVNKASKQMQKIQTDDS